MIRSIFCWPAKIQTIALELKQLSNRVMRKRLNACNKNCYEILLQSQPLPPLPRSLGPDIRLQSPHAFKAAQSCHATDLHQANQSFSISITDLDGWQWEEASQEYFKPDYREDVASQIVLSWQLMDWHRPFWLLHLAGGLLIWGAFLFKLRGL